MKNYSSRMSVFGWTFIVFLVLKLTGYIDWSWWWITAPLWGSAALVLLIIAVILVIGAVIAMIKQ